MIIFFTGCPKGFTRIAGVCYGFFKEIKTWNDAEASCKAKGGFLAEPKSRQENKNIIDLVNGEGSAWIGATDKVNEGHWVWAHSGTNVTFTDWAYEEPNNERGVEDCAHVSYYLNYRWNDKHCDVSLSFVCQICHYNEEGLVCASSGDISEPEFVNSAETSSDEVKSSDDGAEKLREEAKKSRDGAENSRDVDNSLEEAHIG